MLRLATQPESLLSRAGLSGYRPINCETKPYQFAPGAPARKTEGATCATYSGRESNHRRAESTEVACYRKQARSEHQVEELQIHKKRDSLL